MNKINKKEYLEVIGTVIKTLPNNSFFIDCKKKKIIANMASRFRTKDGRRKTKIIVGDTVLVALSLNDLGNGQIISLIEN